MTPRARAALQERILDDIKAAHPGTTDGQIAAAAHVDKSTASRWRSGVCELGLAEIVDLVAAYGAPAGLKALASGDGCDVLARRADPTNTDARLLALDVSVAATHLTREVHAALSDGQCTDEEAEDLDRQIDHLVAKLNRLRARARSAS